MRDKRGILMADDGSRDGENTSTLCILRDGFAMGCIKGLKVSRLEPVFSVREM
jgi:hypothetical protein